MHSHLFVLLASERRKCHCFLIIRDQCSRDDSVSWSLRQHAEAKQARRPKQSLRTTRTSYRRHQIIMDSLFLSGLPPGCSEEDILGSLSLAKSLVDEYEKQGEVLRQQLADAVRRRTSVTASAIQSCQALKAQLTAGVAELQAELEASEGANGLDIVAEPCACMPHLLCRFPAMRCGGIQSCLLQLHGC